MNDTAVDPASSFRSKAFSSVVLPVPTSPVSTRKPLSSWTPNTMWASASR